jgi:hypothetical protein
MGIGRAKLNVEMVSRRIKNRESYSKGQPILAVACNVADGGPSSSGQALSDLVEGPVYASDTDVYIDASGRIVFTDYPNAPQPKME